MFVANDFIGCERELVAFAQRDAAVLEGADAVLRPFRIQHDGDGQVQLLAQALDRFNPGEVFGMVTVRKIEPGYVHARKEHLAQRLFAFARGADGADDLCLAHKKPPNESGKRWANKVRV